MMEFHLHKVSLPFQESYHYPYTCHEQHLCYSRDYKLSYQLKYSKCPKSVYVSEIRLNPRCNALVNYQSKFLIFVSILFFSLYLFFLKVFFLVRLFWSQLLQFHQLVTVELCFRLRLVQNKLFQEFFLHLRHMIIIFRFRFFSDLSSFKIRKFLQFNHYNLLDLLCCHSIGPDTQQYEYQSYRVQSLVWITFWLIIELN